MGKTYVYYSYEQWGRGYIGARNRDPVGDDYLGSYTDQTFNPTEKVVIAEFETFEEALAAEIKLHHFFEVATNPHFANRARQTSTGFTRTGLTWEWSEEERKSRMKVFGSEEFKTKISEVTSGERNGFHGKTHTKETREKLSQSAKGKKLPPRTKEQRENHGNAVRKMLSERSKEEVSEWRKKGWRNRDRTPRIWVTDGQNETLVTEDKVPEGWWRGRRRG